jgi:hypothetical protein
VSTLCTGKESFRVAWRNRSERHQAHLDTLVRKELHTRAPMNSSTPVSPEERSISNHEWMQEDAHLAWLRGVVAIPLALIAQGTRAATANTGCVDHAQPSVSFSTMFMGPQRLPCGATERPIGLERKVLPGEATRFPGSGSSGWAVSSYRSS